MFVMDGDLTAWRRKRTEGEILERGKRNKRERRELSLLSYVSVCSAMLFPPQFCFPARADKDL